MNQTPKVYTYEPGPFPGTMRINDRVCMRVYVRGCWYWVTADEGPEIKYPIKEDRS